MGGRSTWSGHRARSKGKGRLRWDTWGFYSSSSTMKYCAQLQPQMDQITFRQSNCCCCCCRGCCCCCCGLAYKTSAAATAKVNWDFLLLTKRRPQRRAEHAHMAYGQTERVGGRERACHVEGDCVAHLRQNHRQQQHRRVTAATYLPVAEH